MESRCQAPFLHSATHVVIEPTVRVEKWCLAPTLHSPIVERMIQIATPLLALLAACATFTAPPASEFDARFTGRVMRLDFFHTGHERMEVFALDRLRVEGAWPGSRTQLIDDSNLGKYLLEVFDPETGVTLYSRGFASIFGEWETTGEARDQEVRTFEEALRFPEPQMPVQVLVHKRDAANEFREVWHVDVDPSSRHVARDFSVAGDVHEHGEVGDVATHVDLLFLGDGYVHDERSKFLSDVDQLADELFAIEPFKSRRGDFNVRSVFVAARESGISNPRAGTFRDSPLGASYNSLDSDRYVLSLADRRWRDAAAAAPYDHIIMLVNDRKYGGGGIFNLYSTASADSAFAGYLVVHEFGHHFAGLGDEYFTSQVAYEEFTPPDLEPWEPNITALLDPDQLKWKDLVTPGTPLPTTWGLAEYESTSLELQARRAALRADGAPESELESLFDHEQETMTALLGRQAGTVGAFEGAMYQARGLYRPAIDCIMFTRDPVGFCPVCARAIDGVIDQYAR